MRSAAAVLPLLAGILLLSAAPERAAAYSITTHFDMRSQDPASIFNGAPPAASFDESVAWNLPKLGFDVLLTGVSFSLGSTGSGGVRGAVGLTDSLLSYAYRPSMTTFVLPAGPGRPGSYRFGNSVSTTGGQNWFTTTSTDPYAYLDAYMTASYDVAVQYCFFSLCERASAAGNVDDSWRLFGYRSNGAARTIELTLLDQTLPALASGASYEVLSGGCIKTIESLCTVGAEVGSGEIYAPDMSTRSTEESATRLTASKSEKLLKAELDVDGLISAIVGVPLTGIAVDLADIVSLSADAVDLDLTAALQLTRAQSLEFTIGNVYSFDQTVNVETSLGVRRVRAGQNLLIPGVQEFFVTPVVAGSVPHVSVLPFARGTFRDSIGLSLCGGLEIDVLKAAAGISGFDDWSVGPLYSAEAELGCVEIARLADAAFSLPDLVADSFEVLSLGGDVEFVVRALRAPGTDILLDEEFAAVPVPATALLLAPGLLALRRARRPRRG
jgi:hypothetical protein